jgi:flagellar M-ring protein FliF
MLGGGAGQSEEAKAPGPTLPAPAGGGELKSAEIPDRTQIIDMARKNPEATAVVVKQWLKSSSANG